MLTSLHELEVRTAVPFLLYFALTVYQIALPLSTSFFGGEVDFSRPYRRQTAHSVSRVAAPSGLLRSSSNISNFLSIA
jgi:hypothetical protein